MHIAIPYNEILPTKKAHDSFLFREASELALEGCRVDVLIGKGSAPSADLHTHYGIKAPIHLHYLPILRKNNPFGISWNYPFFKATHYCLKKLCPQGVLLSVIKQAADIVRSRSPDIRYIYEAHELAYYPGVISKPYFSLEKKMFQSVDAIAVTTQALKDILLSSPYSLSTPVHVIPLAVDATALPPPSPFLRPTVTYVGQLYKEQGIFELIEIMKHIPEVNLRIIGGTAKEIAQLNPHIPNIYFEGFIPPHLLQKAVEDSHVFIAPFHLTGRMPYVAHTKLYAYRAWGRPVIAPQSSIVQEHLPNAWTYSNYDELHSLLKQVPVMTSVLPEPSPWSKRISELKKLWI